jgi:hypothetical protein
MPVFAFVYSFVYSQLLVMLASFCSLLPTCRLQASSSCCRLRGDEPMFLAFSKHNKSHVSHTHTCVAAAALWMSEVRG